MANFHRPAAFGVGTTAHVEHGDVALVIHQLKQVAIARKDAHPPAPIGSAVGQGAEHVIGLIARGHAQRQIQRLGEDRLQVAQVLEEVLGGHIPVGLVGLVGVVAEGGLGRIEGNHHPLGAEAFAVVEQGFEEAVGDRGGHAGLGAQAPFATFGKGIKTAKGQGVAVHQQQ